MADKPLSRLARIKAEKEQFSLAALKKRNMPEKTGKPSSPAGEKQPKLSEKSIEVLALALQAMLKD